MRRSTTAGRARATPVVLLLAAALVGGCSAPPEVAVDASCGEGGKVDNPVLVLMAQAVPSATLLPCVELLPGSWRHGDVDVRSGSATFAFASASVDSPDEVPLRVRLSADCEVAGGTEVPTDEPGTRRWERLQSVSPAYVGERFYLYDGGCTTLHFALQGAAQVQAVGEASLAVGFVSRDAVRAMVRDRSDGRLQLDPPGGDR
jgi:hypothetical protein